MIDKSKKKKIIAANKNKIKKVKKNSLEKSIK